jgi:hypothetical protein
MPSDRICVDCKAPSPDTQTQYTLISKHGWRVVRGTGPDGRTTLDWRCPKCWAVYKSRLPHAVSQPPPARASRPPPSPATQASAEAGRLFDRALEALGSKPPGKGQR